MLMSKIKELIFSTLLLSMIILPTVYKEIKIVMLILLLMTILMIFFYQKKLFLNKDIFIFFCITIFSGLFFMLIGLLHETPGATSVVTVMVVWPLLWMLFISSFKRKDIINSINKVFIFSTYFIVLYTIFFILAMLNIVPESLFFNLYPSEKMGFSFYDGVIETSLLVFASLLFLVPYLIASTFFDKKISKLKYIFILLSLIVLVLSGRRALVVVVLFSFFSIFLFSFFIKTQETRMIFKKNKKYFTYLFLIIIGLISVAILFSDLDVNNILERFMSGFDFKNSISDGAYERYIQFNALLDGWSHYPLLGNGFGAVTDVIRSDETPWAYELSYVALLFQTGIVGVLIYGSATLWIVWQLIKIIQSENLFFIQIAFPILVGMTSFLIGNATNPYLGKFDFMWVIFIPVLIINLYKLEGEKC